MSVTLTETVYILIDLGKRTVIQIQRTGIVSALLQRFCNKLKILSGSRYTSPALHLLIEQIVSFTILLDIIECFISLRITFFECLSFSFSDSLIGLFTMESGIPIIPTSCIYAALRRLLTLASSHPSSLAIKAE